MDDERDKNFAPLFFFFLALFCFTAMKGKREKREGNEGLVIVLASPESGYLEKGNDDWQSVSFFEASGAASDSP